MPPKQLRITADDLRRRAERLREHVTDDAKETQLCERAAALLEAAAAPREAGEALTLVLNAGKLLGKAQKRRQELYQPIAPKTRRKKGDMSGDELTRRRDEIVAESEGSANRKVAEGIIRDETGMSQRTQRRRRSAEAREYVRPSKRKGE